MRIIFLAVLLSFSITFSFAEEELITDVRWHEKENLLTYQLPKDGRVRIRTGYYDGPVYRTIVNMEKRSKGKNQERWLGKDEAGKIDFLKYGKLHFCVDLPVKQNPDSVLGVKFIESLNAPAKIIVDAQEGLKQFFLKNGAELRVYLDNKLIKLERVTTFPFTVNLRKGEIPAGKHLLTMNLWQALDFSVVAYNSLEVTGAEKAGTGPTGQIARAQINKLALSHKDDKGFWQIFVLTLGNKKLTQLTSSLIDKRYPAWSPDGKKIVYADNSGRLWIMDSNGDNNRKINLSLNCSEPRFSPGGTKIIFTSQDDVYNGSTKIWQVNLDNLQLKKIVNRPWLQYNPSYSPDEKFIIFTDGPELFGQNILKLNLDTNDITQITDNGPYDYDMQGTFLNSGQEIVYSTNEGKGDYEIYKMDKFGRGKINLSKSPQSSDIMPSISGDDSRIFFLSDRTGNFQIWQMNIDGTEAKQLTSGPEISSFSVCAE